MVFANHLLVDTGGVWAPAWYWSWGTSGPAAVMVFFVLSGYVIGLRYSSSRAGPQLGAVAVYFQRRAIRLIPINLAAVLLACAVAESLDWSTVLGNLLFLQNFADYSGHWILVLRENLNLWSLNYEVVFYLLFAVLWWSRISLRVALGVSLGVGFLGWFGGGLPLFVACYAFGFLFWLAGLALAWRATPTADERGNWPSCLLLALITWKLQGVAEILIPLDTTLPRFAGPVVKLYHLDFVPVCIWLVATVARRSFPGLGIVKRAALVIPLLGFGVRLWRSPEFPGDDTALAFAVYGVALAAWRWRPSVRGFERFAWLGAISYALYATARPIQIEIFRLGERLPSGPWSFGVCAMATIAIALGVAWYLERRLQPAISRQFSSRATERTRAAG